MIFWYKDSIGRYIQTGKILETERQKLRKFLVNKLEFLYSLGHRAVHSQRSILCNTATAICEHKRSYRDSVASVNHTRKLVVTLESNTKLTFQRGTQRGD